VARGRARFAETIPSVSLYGKETARCPNLSAPPPAKPATTIHTCASRRCGIRRSPTLLRRRSAVLLVAMVLLITGAVVGCLAGCGQDDATTISEAKSPTTLPQSTTTTTATTTTTEDEVEALIALVGGQVRGGVR
jgi:hypothetical protein